jgi:serine/threonine protein kinase
MSTSSLTAGQVVDERFKVEERLGGGGQGEVYRVVDVTNNEPRALKTLRPDYLPKNLERLKKEVRGLQKVQSNRVLPLIATNLDSYEPGSKTPPYLVAKLAKHRSLADHDYYHDDIVLCLVLFRAICEGVQAIHAQGVLHRDIKPPNILLVESERDVNVADFGLCLLSFEESEGSRLTETREMVGPRFYSAPEQTSLPARPTQKSDIYSLGRLLYFMITGQYEIAATDDYVPVTVVMGQSEPHAVDELIRQMVQIDPKARPENVGRVITDVDRLLGRDTDAVIKDIVETASQPAFQPSREHRRLIKFLKSGYGGASFKEILEYMSNYYAIDNSPPGLSALAGFGLSGKGTFTWREFAGRIETYLEQMEDAGIVTFARGEYSLVEDSSE